MRDIDHVIVGGASGSASRFSDVYDPNTGKLAGQM